jgi:hypothetical protein
VLGNALGEQGYFEEAIAAHSHLGGNKFWSWALGYTYAMADQRDKAHEILDGIEHNSGNGFPLAVIYASLGESEDAIYWLNQVAEGQDPWYPWMIGWFPQLRNLHDHPLVIARAEELGIPLQPSPN